MMADDPLAQRLRLAVSLPDVDTSLSLSADDLIACAIALERGSRYWVRCIKCSKTVHVLESAYRCRFCKHWFCHRCSTDHFKADHTPTLTQPGSDTAAE